MAYTSNYSNTKQDYDAVTNNVYQKLCSMDRPDRELGRLAAWRDLVEMIRKINPYLVKVDVMDIAEKILADEKKFIERDPGTFKVRLTQIGRNNCDGKTTPTT